MNEIPFKQSILQVAWDTVTKFKDNFKKLKDIF